MVLQSSGETMGITHLNPKPYVKGSGNLVISKAQGIKGMGLQGSGFAGFRLRNLGGLGSYRDLESLMKL